MAGFKAKYHDTSSTVTVFNETNNFTCIQSHVESLTKLGKQYNLQVSIVPEVFLSN